MRTFALRLRPDQDLRQSLKMFAQENQIQAGFILTGIGSLKQAQIRFADQEMSTTLIGKFEIISLGGTLSEYGLHLHLAIANSEGELLGGHLDNGCLIYTTAEIVIGVSEALVFAREIDSQTGFYELHISPNPNQTRTL